MVDRQLGEFGEQEVRTRLERALLGTGAQFSGFADRGIDLVVQFESPSVDRRPLHFAVQVKTGDSFAHARGGRWAIRNVGADRFNQWKQSQLPVLFVWVRPTTPAECYYSVISKDTQREHFTISKRAIIGPALRYDLALRMCGSGANSTPKTIQSLLRPALGTALKDFAKSYYRQRLRGTTVTHPVVGPVAFSEHAWRHLTAQGRRQRQICQSLHLLPLAPTLLAGGGEFVGLRRLLRTRRGAWVTEVRLLAYRFDNVLLRGRPPASVQVVLRETITFPDNWLADVALHQHVTRRVGFQSVYEKVGVP